MTLPDAKSNIAIDLVPPPEFDPGGDPMRLGEGENIPSKRDCQGLARRNALTPEIRRAITARNAHTFRLEAEPLGVSVAVIGPPLANTACGFLL